MPIAREPKGGPDGGRFAEHKHPETDEVLTDADREFPGSLADYRVVGFSREVYSAGHGHSQPGGTCDRCGQSIMNVVHLESSAGEPVKVGMDCAERAGLGRQQVREMLRAKYSAFRSEQSRVSGAARRAEQEQLDAELGKHGTLDRYNAGCRCGSCVKMSPHGTLDRVGTDDCVCQECVAAAVDSGVYVVRPNLVLVDASSGEIMDNARSVSTRYGTRWVVDRGVDDNGDELPADWYPYRPKRRTTMTSKGVVEAEAEAEWLFRPGRRGSYPVGMVEALPLILGVNRCN